MENNTKKTKTDLFLIFSIAAIFAIILFCIVAVKFDAVPLKDFPTNFIGATLGALIGAVITLFLLKGQTAVEEQKGKDIRILEKKTEVFQHFIDKLWEKYSNREIDGEDFKEITTEYYSKVMLYLNENRDDLKKDAEMITIGDLLCKIGELINQEKPGDPEILKIIVDIVNRLSIELGLGGKIDPKEIAKITKNVDQITRKAEQGIEPEAVVPQQNDQSISTIDPKIIEKFRESIKTKTNAVLSKNQELNNGDYKLEYCHNIKIQAEYLVFLFKNFPDCAIFIGPFSIEPGRVGKKVGGKYITSYNEPVSFKFYIGPQVKTLDDFRSNKYYGSCVSMKLGDTVDMTIPIAKIVDIMDPKNIDINNREWINKPVIFSQPATVEPIVKDSEKIADTIAKCAVYYYENVCTEKDGLKIKDLLEKHYVH